MSREAMKLALGKIKSARDCHPNAVDTLLFEAEEILEGALAEQPERPYRLLQDNGSKYFGESWDKAEQPAQPQQEPVAARHIGWDYLDNGTLVATYAVPVPERIAPKLYASPPAQRTWVGLTDEEKRQIFEREDYQGWLDYINAIEAKLKEKNT